MLKKTINSANPMNVFLGFSLPSSTPSKTNAIAPMTERQKTQNA